MNYVFLGAGAYGFEAGSRTYFGKSLKDLNLEEAALLAAIPKSPEYSPTRNMEKAKMRRDIVLDQMAQVLSRAVFGSSGRRGQGKTDQARRHRLLPVAAEIDRVGLSGRRDPQISRRKIHDPRRPGRAEGLYDDQRRGAKDRDEGDSRTASCIRSRAQMAVGLSEHSRRCGQAAVDRRERDRQTRSASYKHADWYGDEYEEGEYIKGLDRQGECRRRTRSAFDLGKYKAVVTAREHGP